MVYQWYKLNNVFENIDLEIFDVTLEVNADNEYIYNGCGRIGAIGKTSWYFPLSFEESVKLGVERRGCGMKIIKYPVYSDIIDEYHRILNEYSIQKILNKNEMAPDIYKLLLIRNSRKVSYDWLLNKMEFPEGSILFAQVVEHIDNDGFDNTISVTEKGIPYGKAMDDFLNKCKELRVVPYDIDDENIFSHKGRMKVIDVHKWKRSYLILPPPAPKYVQIELNNSCNAKCKMCNIPYMTRSKGLMSDELFIKILKEANENGVEYITPFLHGEPFLRSDYIEKLKLINEYAPKAKITIFTNASMLSENIIHELRFVQNIDQLVFSFPGGNKEAYERVTGLDYETSLVNIRNSFEILRNIPMRISMPVFEDNADSAEDFYALWEGYPCSAYETYNYLEDVKGTLAQACFEQCDRAFRSMTVMYDGRICLCCMDSDGKYIMGDISKNTMLEIWNGDQYTNLRRLHGICRSAYEPCARCTLDLKTEEYNYAYSNNNR